MEIHWNPFRPLIQTTQLSLLSQGSQLKLDLQGKVQGLPGREVNKPAPFAPFAVSL